MKKILLFLLCFMVAFAAFAVNVSPQPGDTLETVFIVSDDIVVSQAENVPAFESVLYLNQFNYNNEEIEICLSVEAIDKSLLNYGIAVEAVAVSYIGYEMGTIFNITGGVIGIYKTEFG